MNICLNGRWLVTKVSDYDTLRREYAPGADTLIVNGHSRPSQTSISEGDEVLMFSSAERPSPALWRAIYNARYGKNIMELLQAGRVAICGLGGLGSLAAIELARLGVGELLLIDGDQVDATNLARQQYRFDQIGQLKTAALAETIAGTAPLTHIKTAGVWLDKENIVPLLSDWPIICECLDRPESKALLTNTVLSSLPDATLVAASGMAGYGSGNAITSKQLLPHFYLVGDEVSEGEEGIGLMAPRVGLCASAQATLIMRLLLGETTP